MNFNLVKKPKKEEEEVEIKDEDELEEIEEKRLEENYAKKRMLRFMVIIVVVAVLLLIILYGASLVSKQSYTYEDVEEVMIDAAKSYFADHPESLPAEEGSIVEVPVNNLIVEEKMKNFDAYLGEEALCGGSVQVERSGNEFLYTPYLNCGQDYITVELHNKVLEQGTVTSGYGLYAFNGSYIYRGEDVKNYVEMDNSLWRIVRITSNNNIVLISANGVPYIQTWDDRYNEERLYEAGINQYSASRIKSFLEKIYENPNEEDGENILSQRDKARLVSYPVCVGKRSQSSESKNNAEECSQVLQNQRLGLLTLSDYMYASIDPNCKSAASKSCKNYNYLAFKEDWWLVTADKDQSSMVYMVSRSGNVKSETAATFAIVRPVVYLNNRVLYKGGDGSAEKPFKVR